MSVPKQCRSLGRLLVLLGLVLMNFTLAPSAASAAGPLDTVSATGSGGPFLNINITAQSGTLGQNSSGTAFFDFVGGPSPDTGPVTCLSVTGPDRGAGTAGSPTTATLNFVPTSGAFSGEVLAVTLTDNGGNGADIIISNVFLPSFRAPTDCSPLSGGFTATLTDGRAMVFDAPLLPTSKDQCKNGGWRNFPQFKNQGDCVSFVATHGENQPG